MALFTGKGDDGTTYFFGSARRYSKNSPLAWALGTLDEINSFLGLCKVKARKANFQINFEKLVVSELVEEVQQNLFIIQAELAGADKTIEEKKIKRMEEIINEIEKELPPIKSFLVSGSNELQASFDFARTIARRAERVVASLDDDLQPKQFSRSYLNRLSSLLYAFARLSAHRDGINESAPTY